MMCSFTLRKIILALSFLALDAIVADDDSSLIAQAQADGNQILSSDWTLDGGTWTLDGGTSTSTSTNKPGLQQTSSDLSLPTVNNESVLLFAAKENVAHCADLQSRAAAAGGKLKPLRFARREQQQQLSCPVQEEFGGDGGGSGSGVPRRAREGPVVPVGGEGNTLPPEEGSTSEFNPDRKTRPTTMKKLINEKALRPTTDISVCGFQEGLNIPICALYFVATPDAIVSRLHPCRFWRLEDECEDMTEDLWCCKSAYVDQSSPAWRLNVMTQRYFSTAEVCKRVHDAHISN